MNIHHRINFNHRDREVAHSIFTGRKLVTVRGYFAI